jgi:hypothetical protein
MSHIGYHDEAGYLFELYVLNTLTRKIILTLPLKIVCLLLEVRQQLDNPSRRHTAPSCRCPGAFRSTQT